MVGTHQGPKSPLWRTITVLASKVEPEPKLTTLADCGDLLRFQGLLEGEVLQNLR
jgi:hypothetical protein